MNKHLGLQLILVFVLATIQSTSALDFLFNRFDSSSDLSLYGGAAVDSGILTLANRGLALYPTIIPTKQHNTSILLPFSTCFIFSCPGCIFLFLFLPRQGIQHYAASNGNFSNHHVFGVEFNDTDINHMEIHVNSVISGYWLHNQTTDSAYQVWIDYADGIVNVSIAPLGEERPKKPLLSVSLDLSHIFEDEMYVGFTAFDNKGEGPVHRVYAWSFSNTKFSPSHISKGLIAGGIIISAVICCIVAYLFVKRTRRKRGADREMEMKKEYIRRLSTIQIVSSTNNFGNENIIGIGGNGEVYRGMHRGSEVAVKRISWENIDSFGVLSAEISSFRVQHKNLVKLRGWCKYGHLGVILVYEYMENGSLDKRLFESVVLSCEQRIRILKQVASGIMCLHESWEPKVHKDIKATNVLLDKQMNAKLGDYGLARMHNHQESGETTQVVGTMGYMAPEIVRDGRASTQTDVFSFGVLILEVMCGRRAIETGRAPLVDWVREALIRGGIVDVMDARLRGRGDMDEEEVERVVELGVLCAHPDPNVRPTIKQIVKMLKGIKMSIKKKKKKKKRG